MDNQAAPTAKKTKGIKKLWIKLKASMKSDSGSTQSSTATTKPNPTSSASKSAPSAATPTITNPAPTLVEDTNTMATSSAVMPEPVPEKKVEETKPAPQPVMASEVIQVDDDDDDDDDDYDEKPALPMITSVSSDKEDTAIRYQRAQEVFKKYNLEMDPADWQQPNNSSVQRVEKKPRMRVRYTCHECKQTFGREKKCSNCTHTRCDSCVRYPPKKTGDNLKGKKSKRVQPDLSTLTTPTTGACHECKTTFDLGATECENCNHEICSRCLKETVIASPATAPPPTQPVAIAAS